MDTDRLIDLLRSGLVDIREMTANILRQQDLSVGTRGNIEWLHDRAIAAIGLIDEPFDAAAAGDAAESEA